jgi:hypothetical protein
MLDSMDIKNMLKAYAPEKIVLVFGKEITWEKSHFQAWQHDSWL